MSDSSEYGPLIRRFHRGKGFNPDSQDVARHLVNEEDSCKETGDYDFVSTDVESEDMETSNTHNNEESSADEPAAECREPELQTLTDENFPVSRTFELLMNVQLALIFFLASLWLYDEV
ncbi:hypothetical protein B0H19DRAFT_1069539 [Mycena capillaripes]|nr:hypothetical protein B0H19DRAFT_1069539 [Mycena capillaripes]